MASSLSNISVRDLKKAITLRERIETLENKLAALLGSVAPATGGRGGPRNMSAAARARIAAAQRLRWAKHRKSGTPGRRKMSAAARARISAVAKARWARVKAKGGRTLAG